MSIRKPLIRTLHATLIASILANQVIAAEGGGGDASSWVNPDLTNAVYDSKSFLVTPQAGGAHAFFITPDGTTLLVLDSGTDNIYQYTMSTPGDISTASYDSVSFSITTQDLIAYGFEFNSDGTIMLLTGSYTKTIYQYILTTPWDISTMSYANKSFLVSAEALSGYNEIRVSSDGTKLYGVDLSNDTIFQYTMSTLWDITTLSYASKSRHRILEYSVIT